MITPLPPARVSAIAPIRQSRASTPVYSASPPATPPITLSVRLRRSWARGCHGCGGGGGGGPDPPGGGGRGRRPGSPGGGGRGGGGGRRGRGHGREPAPLRTPAVWGNHLSRP